jgi:tetratricopeptide (TPR) repeat protein
MHVKERIFEFISGNVSKKEADQITGHLETCPECMVAYQHEILLESALFNLKEAKFIPGEHWGPLMESAFKHARIKDDPVKVVTDTVWDNAMSRALRTVKPQKKILSFRIPAYRVMAVAASIIAVMGLFFTLKFLQTKHPVQAPVKTALVIHEDIQENTFISSNVHEQKLIKLSERTGISLDRSSKVQIEKLDDQHVAARLLQGRALFSVEEGRYSEFTVHTSHGDIQVAGTAFKVDVTAGMTQVFLIRGKVNIAAKSGETVQAQSSDKIVFKDNIIKERLASKRLRRLLREEIALTSIFSEIEEVAIPAEEAVKLPIVKRKELKIVPKPERKDPALLISEYLKFADVSRENGDYQQAIDLYRKVIDVKPNSHSAQTATHEINMIYLNSLFNLKKAKKGFEKYLKKFPQGDWAEEAVLSIVTISMKQQNYRLVVKYMDRYVNSFPAGHKAKDLLYQKATLQRAELKDPARAKEAYQLFVSRYPKDYRADDARYWLKECERLTNKK